MYKMKKEPGLPSGMVNKPAMNKPAMGKPMKPGMKPMPGVSNLPSGMVNKPAMNKDMAAKKEAIRRMRGDR
jgi:hypothetical protein